MRLTKACRSAAPDAINTEPSRHELTSRQPAQPLCRQPAAHHSRHLVGSLASHVRHIKGSRSPEHSTQVTPPSSAGAAPWFTCGWGREGGEGEKWSQGVNGQPRCAAKSNERVKAVLKALLRASYSRGAVPVQLTLHSTHVPLPGRHLLRRRSGHSVCVRDALDFQGELHGVPQLQCLLPRQQVDICMPANIQMPESCTQPACNMECRAPMSSTLAAPLTCSRRWGSIRTRPWRWGTKRGSHPSLRQWC